MKNRHGNPPPSERSWRSSTPVQSIECCDLLTKNGHVRNRRAMRPNACGAIRFKRSPTRSQMFAGLSEATRKARCSVANHFLCWLDAKGWLHPVTSVWRRIDKYLEHRLLSLRRSSRAAVCSALRSFSPLPFSGRWHGQRCVARNIRAPPLPRLSRFHGRSPMSRFAGHPMRASRSDSCWTPGLCDAADVRHVRSARGRGAPSATGRH